MPSASNVNSSLIKLLQDFQNSDPTDYKAFPKAAEDYLRKCVRKIAPDLPKDIQEESISQMFLQILTSGSRFDPITGDPKRFLFGHLRTAVKQIRAQYCPPGCPTRLPTKKGAERDPRQLPAVPLTDLEDMKVMDERSETIILARCEVVMVLKKAPSFVAIGLILIHYEGKSYAEASTILGLSRFKLKRSMDAFRRDLLKQAYRE
jgi:DNA-directed RNA polymerase specialized sigma24 family protein